MSANEYGSGLYRTVRFKNFERPDRKVQVTRAGGRPQTEELVAESANQRTSDPAPHFDSHALRRCFGKFATGVTIMTTSNGADLAGVTANSFSSLSLDPPLVLWSLSRTSRNVAAFGMADHFAINILSMSQLHISQQFSSSIEDKFQGIDWKPGRTGSPILAGVAASIECRVQDIHDGGDHVLIIGRVLDIAQHDRRPLLFAEGRYGVLSEHPDLKKEEYTSSLKRVEINEHGLLLSTLLFVSYHYLSAALDEHRKAEGVSLSENRVLFALSQTNPISFETLAEKLYLGIAAAQTAVDSLIEKGCVARQPDGGLTLRPRGQAWRESIRARVRAFERRQLADFPPGDIQQARTFLAQLIESMRPASLSEWSND